MRILLATDGNLERQGINSFMLAWITALRSIPECSIEVSVYYLKSIKDQKLADCFRALDVKLFSSNIPDNGTMLNFTLRKKARLDIHFILNDAQFDVVHINSSANGFTTVVLQEAVRAGVPIRISHAHRRNYDNIIKKTYLIFLRAYICCASTVYAGCSVDAGLYMFGRTGVNSSKWHFVPNTIDTERFSFRESARMKCRQELNLSEDELLIGAVGLLENYKNHVFLLDVMKNLCKAGKKATLILFGNGSLLHMLQDKVAAMELSDQVIFYGVTNDISSWLSALDCYVMPSLVEGLGIAAVEAQANGLPCLLSDHVPPEVDLCTDVYHLPIDVGPEPWVQKILSLPVKTAEERKLGGEAVRKAGFGKESLPDHVRSLYGIR